MAGGEIVVVGAGIFGITASIELRRRGCRVTVLDPGPLPHPDASSTDVSKAIRADYGRDVFYSELMEAAFRGWQSWNDGWGVPLYHEDGFLLLSQRPLEPGSFEYESERALRARGFPLEPCDRDDLRARFPAWNAERFHGGYLNRRAGWAESGAVVGRLVETARGLGVDVREGVGLDRLIESDARVEGVRGTDGATYRADRTIVAAGAWTPCLVPGLEEVMWVVGQPVLHFHPADPAPFRPPRFPVWAADISTSGWYGFPALPDGRVKVANHGPGRPIHPAAPREVDPTAETTFRAFLADALPALSDAPIVGRRLCLYCDTWDGDFYIDHVPHLPGLVVAAGGSGHGFKFAPVLGGIVADVVLEISNPHHSRFAWRERAERRTEEARHGGADVAARGPQDGDDD